MPGEHFTLKEFEIRSKILVSSVYSISVYSIDVQLLSQYVLSDEMVVESQRLYFAIYGNLRTPGYDAETYLGFDCHGPNQKYPEDSCALLKLDLFSKLPWRNLESRRRYR